VGYLEANGLAYALPDGRELFRDVSFKVSGGTVVALVGANGVGKTTLQRILSGELVPCGDAAVHRLGPGLLTRARPPAVRRT
jgi:ABC-type multidrug transport system ATPase subunit